MVAYRSAGALFLIEKPRYLAAVYELPRKLKSSSRNKDLRNGPKYLIHLYTFPTLGAEAVKLSTSVSKPSFFMQRQASRVILPIQLSIAIKKYVLRESISTKMTVPAHLVRLEQRFSFSPPPVNREVRQLVTFSQDGAAWPGLLPVLCQLYATTG